MLTPVMTESSTSSPFVINEKAVSTAVMDPPFLNLFPLADEMTSGLIFWTRTAGPFPAMMSGLAATSPATALVFTKSRREILLRIVLLRSVSVHFFSSRALG
jgi:hypothetical protein